MTEPITSPEESTSSKHLRSSRRRSIRFRHKLRVASARLIPLERRFHSLDGKPLAGHGPVVALSLTEHLGDIVAAEPLLRQVRARHHEARLIWVVRPIYAPVLQHHPALSGWLEVGCLSEWMRLSRSAAFHKVYDLHLDGRDCPLCREPVRRPPPVPSIRDYYSHGNLLTVFQLAADLPRLDGQPRLHVPPDVSNAVDRMDLPRDFVVFHGQANRTERNWIESGWRSVIRHAREAGLAVVEVGLERMGGVDTPGFSSLVGKLSILESAEVIRRARAFVGIDSGPAHLANATNTPGVILLGHWSRFEVYMPYSGAYANGFNAEIVRVDGATASIEPIQVTNALDRVLSWGAGRAEPAGAPRDP